MLSFTSFVSFISSVSLWLSGTSNPLKCYFSPPSLPHICIDFLLLSIYSSNVSILMNCHICSLPFLILFTFLQNILLFLKFTNILFPIFYYSFLLLLYYQFQIISSCFDLLCRRHPHASLLLNQLAHILISPFARLPYI